MKQFLNKDSLSTWDMFSIIIYSLISVFVYYIGQNNLVEWSKAVSFYSFGTPLFLYLFNYRSLRNLYVYIFWVLISFVHIYMYFKFSAGSTWTTPIGTNWFDYLQYNWVFLLYFQFARFIHLKFNKKELVGPTYGGSYDTIDGRKIDNLDYLFFLLFLLFGLS